MGKRIRVFVDSDVVISAIISEEGAGFQLLEKEGIERWISNLSVEEIEVVVERMGLDKNKLKKILRLYKKVELEKKKLNKEKLSRYVLDVGDIHVLAGAVESEVDFLLTYNMRHYKKRKIENDWGVICMEPGYFLQYLREKRKD